MILSLLVILVAGISWSINYYYVENDSNHAGQNEDGHYHTHGTLDPIEAQRPYPDLTVDIRRVGANRILNLRTENFKFKSPVDTGVEGPNVGHAHLYVNGESIAMFYESNYQLPDFMPGQYRLKVTLNDDKTHAPLTTNGEVISDTLSLTVSGDTTQN